MKNSTKNKIKRKKHQKQQQHLVISKISSKHQLFLKDRKYIGKIKKQQINNSTQLCIISKCGLSCHHLLFGRAFNSTQFNPKCCLEHSIQSKRDSNPHIWQMPQLLLLVLLPLLVLLLLNLLRLLLLLKLKCLWGYFDFTITILSFNSRMFIAKQFKTFHISDFKYVSLVVYFKFSEFKHWSK